jgi:hypothetical protein
LSLPPLGRLPHLKSDDEVLISRLSHRPALVLLMLRFLSCAAAFPAFTPTPPLLLFTLNRPHRLAADARSGMVHTELLPFPLGCDIRATKYTDEVIPNKRNVF